MVEDKDIYTLGHSKTGCYVHASSILLALAAVVLTCYPAAPKTEKEHKDGNRL